MNKRDIPPEKLNELYRMAGSDPKLQQYLRKGDFEGALRCLPEQDAQMIKGILSDPKKLKAVLASPEVQKMIRQLKNGQ